MTSQNHAGKKSPLREIMYDCRPCVKCALAQNFPLQFQQLLHTEFKKFSGIHGLNNSIQGASNQHMSILYQRYTIVINNSRVVLYICNLVVSTSLEL